MKSENAIGLEFIKLFQFEDNISRVYDYFNKILDRDWENIDYDKIDLENSPNSESLVSDLAEFHEIDTSFFMPPEILIEKKYLITKKYIDLLKRKDEVVKSVREKIKAIIKNILGRNPNGNPSYSGTAKHTFRDGNFEVLFIFEFNFVHDSIIINDTTSTRDPDNPQLDFLGKPEKGLII